MMNHFFVVGVILFTLPGCGGFSGPQVIAVCGTVTLDGEPLEDARVEFVPKTGRPSTGVTDSEGHYDLVYTDTTNGALTGGHTVKISTGRDEVSIEGKIVEAAMPESVPPRYNANSELTADVDMDTPEINFELESK